MATKDYSSKQESTIARYLGWSVVSGSGSRDCHPGDIQSESWLGECKTHVNPNTKICFIEDVWRKISDEAASKFKYPVLFVDDGSQSVERTWCMYKVSSVHSSELFERPFPFKYIKNISFYHSALLCECRQCRIDDQVSSDNIVFTAALGGQKVGIIRLPVFAEVFGGE